MFYKIQLFAIFCFIVASFASPVLASEIIISGNGSETVSQAGVNVTSNVAVTQNNSANITNNVAADVNTGANSANENTGNTTINTGNITSNETITNTANNSIVNTECCPNQNGTEVKITDNGANSNNNVSANMTTNSTITVNQVADISNVISGNLNTGNNFAYQNNGSVNIETGQIKAFGSINNTLNQSVVHQAIADPGSLVVSISGNGAGSKNNLNLSVNNNFQTYINNLASLSNVLNMQANTGGNIADKNQGDINIKTGDISLLIGIDNFANTSDADLSCCLVVTLPPVTPPAGSPGPCDNNQCPSTPQPSSGPGPNIAQGGPAGGAVLGTSSGQILPATGTNLILVMTLVSLLMFLLGLYLRLHPGQDPGLATK